MINKINNIQIKELIIVNNQHWKRVVFVSGVVLVVFGLQVGLSSSLRSMLLLLLSLNIGRGQVFANVGVIELDVLIYVVGILT